MNTEWKIKIIDVGYRITRDVFIFRKTPTGIDMMQDNGTLQSIPEGSAILPEPTLQLDPEALQALSDELSRVGYKPEKGFVQGKLDATEKHLEDMRKLLKLK